MMEDTLELKDFEDSLKPSKCAKWDTFSDHNKMEEMSVQAKQHCIQATWTLVLCTVVFLRVIKAINK